MQKNKNRKVWISPWRMRMALSPPRYSATAGIFIVTWTKISRKNAKNFKNNAKMCCKKKFLCYNLCIKYVKSYEKAANREHTGTEKSFTGWKGTTDVRRAFHFGAFGAETPNGLLPLQRKKCPHFGGNTGGTAEVLCLRPLTVWGGRCFLFKKRAPLYE